MRPNEHNISERRDPNRRGGFELFFYEQVGARYYLRFTRLALFLIVCLTVVPMMLLFALFLWNRNNKTENTNVNIVIPTPTPRDYGKPIILPAPPAPVPPRVTRQPGAGVPAQQIPPVPAGNDNRPPTPSPTPARTPT